MMAKAKDTSGLQRALNMEDVPKKKWPGMLKRTFLGALFIGLGAFLAIAEMRRASGGATLTQWVIYAGIGLVLLGATIWSTQVVTKALLALASPIQAIRAAWKS